MIMAKVVKISQETPKILKKIKLPQFFGIHTAVMTLERFPAAKYAR